MKKEQIRIHENCTYGFINSELHGQFIEFLGTCIYDGIWVGEESNIPNIHGLRKDAIDALAQLEPPIIRWPGGCYADVYHWRNGIGKREERPVTYNENFNTFEMDTNQFGTHEFMELCRLVNAKPWLNINMLTGNPSEMRDWMEYCNRSENTSLAKERCKNGSEEPFHVKYWGIGNESWCGGGMMTAQDYSAQYRRFSSAAPVFTPTKDDDKPYLIACGPDGNKPLERKKWTKDLFQSFSKYRQPRLNGIDLHFYNWNLENDDETETDFSEKDWYRVIYGCLELEQVICEQFELIQEGLETFPKPEVEIPGNETTSKCDLIIGEWGNWHKVAFDRRPALFQQCTMRDAITTALTLNILQRNCNQVKMACVAQSVNVLNSIILTEGEKFVKTPNYDVFELYKVHRASQAVIIDDIEKSDIEKRIFSFVSRKEDSIYVSLINIDMKEEHTIELIFDNTLSFEECEELTSQNPNDCNTFDNPNLIRKKKGVKPKKTNQGYEVTLSPASVNLFIFKI